MNEKNALGPRKMTLLIIAVALVFIMLFVSQLARNYQSIELNGTATVTVLNSAPSVNDITVLDAGFRVRELFLEKEYIYTINVSDSNTLGDIQNVKLEIWTSNQTTQDGNCNYVFQYDKLASKGQNPHGSFYQTYPENGDDLNITNCTVSACLRNATGNWNFAITLPDTESCNFIFIKASVTDSSGEITEMTEGPFGIIKILESTIILHPMETPDKQSVNIESDALKNAIFGISLIVVIGLFFGYRKSPTPKWWS